MTLQRKGERIGASDAKERPKHVAERLGRLIEFYVSFRSLRVLADVDIIICSHQC